jgi:hypothetical protein
LVGKQRVTNWEIKILPHQKVSRRLTPTAGRKSAERSCSITGRTRVPSVHMNTIRRFMNG